MASYDEFAQRWREQKHKGLNLAHDYLEKPAMQVKIPDLKGKRVLDLGCGSGEECLFLFERGAEKVVGIDSSEELLALARIDFKEVAGAEFVCMKIEDLNFAPDSFDYVYSSLAMHYVQEWSDVFRRIRSCTTSESRVLFSTHHPVTWGSELTRTDSDDQRMMGYRRPKDKSQAAQVYGDYNTCRKIEDLWFDQLKVEFFHKPFSRMFHEIQSSGYRILDLVEPLPAEEVQSIDPNFFEITSRIPPFIILEVQ